METFFEDPVGGASGSGSAAGQLAADRLQAVLEDLETGLDLRTTATQRCLGLLAASYKNLYSLLR
jgi:hypothetical protein